MPVGKRTTDTEYIHYPITAHDILDSRLFTEGFFTILTEHFSPCLLEFSISPSEKTIVLKNVKRKGVVVAGCCGVLRGVAGSI